MLVLLKYLGFVNKMAGTMSSQKYEEDLEHRDDGPDYP